MAKAKKIPAKKKFNILFLFFDKAAPIAKIKKSKLIFSDLITKNDHIYPIDVMNIKHIRKRISIITLSFFKILQKNIISNILQKKFIVLDI
jgi:hypothetical protein